VTRPSAGPPRQAEAFGDTLAEAAEAAGAAPVDSVEGALAAFAQAIEAEDTASAWEVPQPPASSEHPRHG
jgi:hypothetical protein